MKVPASSPPVRHLVLVLGDQLNCESVALEGFDPGCDMVWMAEVAEESTHVWSHQARIALFLAAMRHFREALRARGWKVAYRQLDETENTGTLGTELTKAIEELRPQHLIMVQAGEWRVAHAVQAVAQRFGLPLEIRPDRHFLCSPEDFAAHARGRKQLRMEFFYREQRRRHGILMDGEQPVGGAWNFDAENRENFDRSGPGPIPEPIAFAPDDLTRDVLQLVATKFPQHPGSLRHFDWPVTPEQARAALTDFIQHRLPDFGRFQDAMWTNPGELLAKTSPRTQAFLFHSRLSTALNLKLLDPREVLAAAEAEFRAGRVSLASAEGFIRQILGWREYVRGIYWHFMPEYQQRNALNATAPLPSFYWTGETEMRCLREVIGQTLEFGYAHHIQRLMVTGLFALLLGVHPQKVHEWYLAVYVDAVEWVELPNTLGMSQFADGGVMASKPYVASGKYVQRMSNYCGQCRFDPAQATGAVACPFTTLYWDFLIRHETLLRQNQRMTMQLKNLSRFSAGERETLSKQAATLKALLAAKETSTRMR